jgi:hypothetical protein
MERKILMKRRNTLDELPSSDANRSELQVSRRLAGRQNLFEPP